MATVMSKQVIAPGYVTEVRAIWKAITDYMECWYGVGYEKLPAAIHPAIYKRKYDINLNTEKPVIKEVTASQLIETARYLGEEGKEFAYSEWINDITIFDVFQNIASAKAVGDGWVDYIHLANIDGGWKIMHILFENPRQGVLEPDYDAIYDTVLDYMVSWYSHEYRRLENAFHPALVKRGLYPHGQSGSKVLSVSSVSDMVERVKASYLNGKRKPKEDWVVDITIFDAYQEIATAKAVGDGWVDYLHLVEMDQGWKIVNIFYECPESE
jgi:hypothetical protein